jgi:oligoribonuclease
LNVLAEGPELAIHHSDEVIISLMDEWNVNQHGGSGLIQRVKESKYSTRDAELATIEFLREHVDKGASPICGNSVGQDRRFLVKYMPDLEDYFHYRNLDVSTVKELARRWNPEALHGFVKKSNHLALDDVYDSIGELVHYRKTFFL